MGVYAIGWVLAAGMRPSSVQGCIYSGPPNGIHTHDSELYLISILTAKHSQQGPGQNIQIKSY